MEFKDYRNEEYIRLTWKGKAVQKVSESSFQYGGRTFIISPEMQVIGANPREFIQIIPKGN